MIRTEPGPGCFVVRSGGARTRIPAVDPAIVQRTRAARDGFSDMSRLMLDEAENDGYHEERGEHDMMPIDWAKDGQMITVGPRAGWFGGVVENREFRPVRVGPARGVGWELPPAQEQLILGSRSSRRKR